MEVKMMTNVLAKNDAIADTLHKTFQQKGIFVLNLLGSPGAGKTTLLEKTLGTLAKKYRIAVIEGDLYTAKDAKRIEELGVQVIQINTAGGCHLDARMIEVACESLPLDELDVIIIENVGNLVCPAEFIIGEDVKVVVLSVTEGEDKPLKYPLIFKQSKAVILNKVDLYPYIGFRREEAIEDITNLNPSVALFEISATKEEGIASWITWLSQQIDSRKKS